MQVRTTGIDIIRQMGPIRFRRLMINHPTIVAMFDPDGRSTSSEEAWKTRCEHPSHSWAMERQKYLHEVIDRHLASLFATGFETLDELVACFQRSMDEVVAYASANSPQNYLGEENSAFKDGCTYQLMVIMSAIKNFIDDADSALVLAKENWTLAPDSLGFLSAEREFHARAKQHLVKRLTNALTVLARRMEAR